MSKKKKKQIEEKTSEQAQLKRIFQYNSPGHFEKENACFLSALDDAIDREDIFNIGVIAPYGSGKSSFIKTYFDNNPRKKRKTCNISLATFSDSKIEESEMGKIEKSILEQILFKRRHSWFSKTKLDRIHGKIKPSLFFSFFLITTITLAILSILECTKTLPYSAGGNFYFYFGFAILFGLVTSFLGFYGLKVNKVAFKNIEVEFSQNKEASVLNLFIDEIINYCSESKVRYFVFEDIDRFNCVSLFLKLREINRLINENELMASKVTFIYCVRDEIFSNTVERAKFFDFVISLVPVLNPNNAREFIVNSIKENKDEELFISESLVMDVCIYLKDIRVLHNIVNDYIVYHDSLTIRKNDNDKLFAMMVYKNLFPSDFASLQSNSGAVYNIFNSHKEKAISNANLSIISEMNECEKIISESSYDDAKSEFAKLKQRISGILLENGNLSTSLQPIGGSKSINNKTVQKYDSDLAYLYIEYTASVGYYGSTTNYKYMSIDSLKQYLDNKTPNELEEQIFGKRKKKYQEKLNILRIKQSQHKRMSVADLISGGFFDIGDLTSLKSNKYLYFAVVNGYIDESYFKFSGRQDTELDNEYIDKVLTNSEIDPEEIIHNPSLVISRLSINKFGTKSILNYSIADALFYGKKEFKDKRNAFLSYLSTNTNETIQFVVGYFLNGLHKEDMLSGLRDVKYNTLIDDVALTYGIYSRETIDFLKEIISISKNNDSLIAFFNSNNVISNVIENNDHPIEEFFYLFNSEEEFINFLNNNRVLKIKHIDDVSSISNMTILNLFNKIIENLMFEINGYNVSLIAKAYFKKDCANVACFLRATNVKLKEFFSDNINALLISLLDNDYKFSDDRDVVKDIMANDKISIEIKNNYLLHLNNKVEYLDNLSPEIYGTLLMNNLLLASFSSISKLLKNKNVDNKLVINFVCNNISLFNDSISKSDFIFLINQEEFSIGSVTELCRHLNERIGISDITNDGKRSIAIKEGVVVIDSNSLKSCKGMNDSIIACLSVSNELIDRLSEVYNIGNDYINLIEKSNLSDDIKAIIISKYYDAFSSQLNDQSLYVIEGIVLTNRDVKYDCRLLASLLKIAKSEEDVNQLLNICINMFSNKETINVVKDNDPALFSLLNGGQDKITVELAVLDNIYFKLLESKNIIKSLNKRVNKCNVNVTLFKTILANN